MNEEPTKNLPSHSFEERILAEFARLAVEFTRLAERFDQLEEKVERRLQDTRPIWEDVQMRLGKLDSKFDFLIEDVNEVRYQQKTLARRVALLESPRTE